MRIAFSGTGNSGKSTMVKSFLHTWKQYETPEKTYRDILKEENLTHSTETTTETQNKILNFMIDQVSGYSKGDKVIFDRCPLDNLAYTIWCNEKKKDEFTREFVTKQINLMKESMRSLDIIFLCRFDVNQKVQDDGFRETNVEFILEIDNIFNSFFQQYSQNPEADIFFPKGDSPAIIELPHNAQERIDLVHQYVGDDGTLIDDEPSILGDVDKLESLLLQQENALDAENKEKELYKRFGL
jgi:GTPase SAR1 family protein|tara:strand:+ start:236 stop:958 length:723 start_codon:yes stop_codon:yes gene_type:complete